MDLAIDRVHAADPRQRRSTHHSARMVISPEKPEDTSPFLLMAEDWFAPPAGFPTHPHRGMETVTFVVEGQMLHEDHTGASGVLDAGDVEFMTAGSGVLHSEMPGPAGVHSLQLWLNLPARLKSVPAKYTNLGRKNAPVHREPGVEVRVYAGRVGAAAVAHGSTWPITLADVSMAESAVFELLIPSGDRMFAYVLAGEAALGANRRSVHTEQVAWAELTTEGNGGGDTLRIEAVSATRLLVYCSPVIEEPVVMGGPFVMNTEAQIEQAYADLRAGRLTNTHVG